MAIPTIREIGFLNSIFFGRDPIKKRGLLIGMGM